MPLACDCDRASPTRDLIDDVMLGHWDPGAGFPVSDLLRAFFGGLADGHDTPVRVEPAAYVRHPSGHLRCIGDPGCIAAVGRGVLLAMPGTFTCSYKAMYEDCHAALRLGWDVVGRPGLVIAGRPHPVDVIIVDPHCVVIIYDDFEELVLPTGEN